MYVLKNAAKNLLRNRGRNILLGVILLAMLISIVIAVIINTTTDQIIADYKSSFGSEVYINQDPEKLQKILNSDQYDTVPGIGIKTELGFSDSNYLKKTRYTASIPTKLFHLKAVGEDAENQADSDASYSDSYANSSDTAADFNVTLLGYSSNYELNEFKTGTRKVMQGAMPKSGTDALISENLAALNDLKVGDSITLETQFNKVSTKLTLHICGIYYDGTKDVDLPYMPAQLRRSNEILTSADTVLSYAADIASASKIDEDFIDYQPTYILKDPEDLSAFEKEVRAKGLPEFYTISTDTATYNSIVKPVENMAKIVTVFLVLVLVIGGLILIFLSALAIRERKYEIGVLRAMGMKKGTVAREMMYESLLLVALCLAIGLGVGSAAAAPISERMIQNQVQATQEDGAEMEQNGTLFVDVDGDSDQTASAAENPLANASLSLTPQATAEIAGFALLLALLSSASGLIYILRYEPVKILSERN